MLKRSKNLYLFRTWKLQFEIYLSFGACLLGFHNPAAAQLVLDGAFINISGGTGTASVTVVVGESSTNGITRLGTGGHIYTEGQYNAVYWSSGTGTGNYVFPFGYSNAEYIPFTFDKTSPGSSNISASTWNTDQANVPYPGESNVPAVNDMTGTGDAVTSAIDRFWDIRSSEPVTGNITFSYRGVENTTAFPLEQFKAQHWNGSLCCGWDPAVGPGNPGVTSGVGSVGPVLSQTTFSPWVLTRSAAPLGITPVYATLTQRLNADFYSSANGFLFFKYTGEYNSGTLKYSIYDKSRAVVLSDATPDITSPPGVHYGDNRFIVDVNALTVGEFYTLEVVNEKKEISKLKFKREP